MSTALARCVLFRKKLESETGRNTIVASNVPAQVVRDVPKLNHPDEADFGDLAIDSSFFTGRVFNEPVKNIVGESVWLRGRFFHNPTAYSLEYDLTSVVCQPGSKELDKYAETLPNGSVVDVFGKVTKDGLEMTNLYGISLQSTVELNEIETAILGTQSTLEQLFREELYAHNFFELPSAKDGLQRDFKKVFSVSRGNKSSILEVLMSINENYSDVLHVIKRMFDNAFLEVSSLERYRDITQKQNSLIQEIVVPDSTIILTSFECAALLGVAELQQFDIETLSAKVKHKYETDFFIIDKLPADGISVPDFYNSNVCNKFAGFFCGVKVLTGQQNVHDGTMIRGVFDTNQGQFPSAGCLVDLATLSRLYLGQLD